MEITYIEVRSPEPVIGSPLTRAAEHAVFPEDSFGQMFKIMEDLQTVMRQRDAAMDAMANAQREVLRRLAAVAEWKDTDTGQHIVRIGVLSAVLAHLAGMQDSFCEHIFVAAPMHDLGKVGVPDAILKKPGPLTEQEQNQMRQHPQIGASMLSGSRLPELQMAAEIALCHHEKYDGTGYPRGLSRGEIPFSARIVALVDFFDALLMDRCYRQALPVDQVRTMIGQLSNFHFDPALVAILQANESLFLLAREQVNRDVCEQSSAVLPPGYWKKLLHEG